MTAKARRAGRPLAWAALAASAVMALTAAGGAVPARAASPPASPRKSAPAGNAARPARDIVRFRQLRRAAPAPAAPATAPRPAIDIPAIGVRAHLATLGQPTLAAGPVGLLLPVPPLAKAAVEAGWYQFTATPGSAGNAVIAGHVDTYAGPAVFYDLYELRRGDTVYVTTGGTRRRFAVTSVREVPKSGFPVNQVFGATKRHALWLITCGGDFDYLTGHYLDNIVVSATWTPPAAAKNPPGKAPANRAK